MMKIFSISTTVSALALMTSPAFADLTAEDVLADQLRMLESSGFEASVASESKSGDTLTTGNLMAEVAVEGQNMTLEMAGITLVEQGDGTVRIEYPASSPIKIAGSTPEGDFSAEMMLNHTGMSIVASGTPDALRYDYNAPEVSITDLKLDVPDMPENGVFDIAMVARNLVGFGEFTGGDVRDYVADFTIGAVTFDMNVAEMDETGGSLQLTGGINDITTQYTGTVAPTGIMDSFADAIEAGVRTEGTMAHGAMNYSMAIVAPEGPSNIGVSADSGSLDFAFNENGIDYGGTTSGMSMNVQVAQFPLPISISMAETGGRFRMPLVPSEETQTFGLRMLMRDLVIDDMLWGMFDPAGQLPRDPATLIVDIEGEGVLAEDVFDPDYAETASGAPGSLDAARINELRLSVLGAELTGTGDFTFANTGPVPEPVGAINLNLSGGNTLLDTLVNMGLVPQEQAMGARMFMGLFARPGDGPDTLVSTIEIKEGGSVFANGQQIR